MRSVLIIFGLMIIAFYAGWQADHSFNPRYIVYYEPLWPGTELPKDTIYKPYYRYSDIPYYDWFRNID